MYSRLHSNNEKRARGGVYSRPPQVFVPGLTIERIIALVCERFNVTPERLLALERRGPFAEPRRISMWLSQNLTNLPQSHISSAHNRESGAVHSAVLAVERARKRSAEFMQLTESLKQTLIRAYMPATT